jgi:hypothetical protein
VNYGFGYFGHGYEGGYWRDRTFYYNRSVNNVNITNVHIYNKTVVNNTYVNRVSYNGGRGGINARQNGLKSRRCTSGILNLRMQMQHERAASGNQISGVGESWAVAVAATSGLRIQSRRASTRRWSSKPTENRSFEIGAERIGPWKTAALKTATSRGAEFGRGVQRKRPRPENRVRTMLPGNVDRFGNGGQHRALGGKKMVIHENAPREIKEARPGGT